MHLVTISIRDADPELLDDLALNLHQQMVAFEDAHTADELPRPTSQLDTWESQ